MEEHQAAVMAEVGPALRDFYAAGGSDIRAFVDLMCHLAGQPIPPPMVIMGMGIDLSAVQAKMEKQEVFVCTEEQVCRRPFAR